MNVRELSGWILVIGGFFFLCASANAQIKFIENKCQWPEQVHFAASVPGGTMRLQPGGFSYSFIDQHLIDELHHAGHGPINESSGKADGDVEIDAHRVDVSFVGANLAAKPSAFGKRPEYYNYYLGTDATRWSSFVAAYDGVQYADIYPGVDLKVYSSGQNIKYDFNLDAGVDPTQISLSYAGIDEVKDEQGDLIVSASKFSIREKQPVAFQWIEGKKIYVKCQYNLADKLVSFRFPDGYDSCYPLVIDPLLIFSTYSGSTADNWGSTATPGERGTLYSAGVTSINLASETFPATPGAFQVNYGGAYDIGILKYDSTGSQLLYATYLGGSESESAHSLVVNDQNELLVFGTTGSGNFPTTEGAFSRSFSGGTPEANVIFYGNGSDLFITRLSADGGELLAGTYVGGSSNDGMNPSTSPLVRNYGDQLRGDIITDVSGNIYVSSVTISTDFPGVNSFSTTYRGGLSDAIVMKLNPDLSGILWSAFLGGSSVDASHTIKFDSEGNVFVAGGTGSGVDFLSVPGGYQNGNAGGIDGWIAKIKNDGSELLATTQTGQNTFDQIYFIDVDAAGSVYAYGQTTSTAFPRTPGIYQVANSGQFLQKFSNDLSELIFSTVFGTGTPIPNISPTAFLVNDCDNIYMSGWGGELNANLGFWNSSTVNMPITPDAFQSTTTGSDFYFIVLTANATELLYATYLGGTQSKTHVDGGTSRFDKGGIVYHAVCSGCRSFNTSGGASSDFPTTENAWSRVNRSTNCNNAAFKFDLSSLKARLQTNSVALDQPNLNEICFPDPIVFQNLSTGGRIYEWDFGDGSELVKQDTSYITHFYQDEGSYLVKLVIIDEGTCIGRDSTFATVTVNKAQGFVGVDQVMCFGAGARLVAGGGVTYEWHTAEDEFKSSQPNPLVNPKEDTRYFVEITDLNGCVIEDSVDIRVIPGIDLKFEYEKIYDCFSRPTVRLRNLTDPEEEVFFDFGDGVTSDQDIASHHYTADGQYQVRLVGTREACIYENQVVVDVNELLVPNVITPDEFVENNAFTILYGGRKISETSLTVSLTIFNRWGKPVFSSTNYRDDWEGENVEPGIYYYDLTVEGETSCKGWVQVIK